MNRTSRLTRIAGGIVRDASILAIFILLPVAVFVAEHPGRRQGLVVVALIAASVVLVARMVNDVIQSLFSRPTGVIEGDTSQKGPGSPDQPAEIETTERSS